MSTGGAHRTPTRVSDVLPALRGRGVLLAAPTDAAVVRQTLSTAGFLVAEAHLGRGEESVGDDRSADTLSSDPVPTSLRTAQAAVAEALRLPETAGRNLDALVDSLRDLATWWPGHDRIVLLLHESASLVDSDLPGWHTLTEILSGATADLWRDGGPGDVAFETVALVDQHGVLAIPPETTPSAATDTTDPDPSTTHPRDWS